VESAEAFHILSIGHQFSFAWTSKYKPCDLWACQVNGHGPRTLCSTFVDIIEHLME